MVDLEEVADELMLIADKISSGEIPEYQHNELYTIGAFDMFLFNHKDPAVLFELLVVLCERYSQITRKSRKGFFELLSALALSTQTTELPPELEKILTTNKSEPGVQSMIEWYRLR